MEAYSERERPVGIAVKPLGQYAKPLYGAEIDRQARRPADTFEPVELDHFAWSLDRCDPALSEADSPPT